MNRPTPGSFVRPSKSTARLVRSAGRAAARKADLLETLESRLMLAGDHASFGNFPNVNAGDDITLNAATGEASRTGIIEPLGVGITEQNDLFKFTAVQNPNKPVGTGDFISIKADTVNSSGSTLNTKLAIYTLGAGNTPVLFTQASGDGTLTGGTPTDAWVGFVATPGSVYYVLVTVDAITGAGSTGAYTLFIDGLTDAVTVDATSGAKDVTGKSISRVGGDNVFSIILPNTANFDSLATATAFNPSGALDSRLDIYASNGQFVAGDSETGRLNDAFATWKSSRGKEFYIRVRSDRPTASTGATGAYTLRVDMSASAITLDPVLRRASQAPVGVGGTTTNLFSFVSQGTGTAIIKGTWADPFVFVDTVLHMFDENGASFGINDDDISSDAVMRIQVVGGKTYYGYLEDFDNTASGSTFISVEANTTYDRNDTTTDADNIDDHANLGDFTHATQLKWSDPRLMPNYLKGGTLASGTTFSDRDKTVVTRGEGRIYKDPTIADQPDTDIFTFTPQVDMQSDWGGVPEAAATAGVIDWYRGSTTEARRRPASRLMVLLTIDADAPFIPNSPVGFRIYDSRGNVLADRNTSGFDPRGGTPEGALVTMWDPASFPAAIDPMTVPMPNAMRPLAGSQGIKVWGGQQYFIEVYGTPTFWSGRYSFIMFVDSSPNLDTANPPFRKDQVSRGLDQLEASTITSGSMLELGFSGGNIVLDGARDGAQDLSTGFERMFKYGTGAPGFPDDPFQAGNNGTYGIQESGYAGIERYDDTDIYYFVAPFTGTVEIRLNTTNISDFYSDFWTTTDPKTTPPPDPTVTTTDTSETYDSPLDGALRIFRNDFQEVAYNNDNPAISGESQSITMGTNGARTFHRRDPRVVFSVTAGVRYFVQVESGQAANIAQWQTDKTTVVPWANAIGSYELMLHGTIATNFGDDHIDSIAASTTLPIAIDSAHGETNGVGSVTGGIQSTTDGDVFQFTATTRGSYTLQLTRNGGGTLLGVIDLFNANTEFVNTAAANAAGTATLSFNVVPGDRFYVRLTGSAGTTGNYRLTVTAPAYADDHADLLQIPSSTLIPLFDFLGSGTATGRINQPGDTDVFRFAPTDFGVFSVSVNATSSTLDPVVEVYETSVDPVGNAIFLRIAQNDNASGTTRNAQDTFSVTPNRTAGRTGLTYPYYFILVRGAASDTDYGNYTVSLGFPPTDDHPDANEYSFADTISIDSSTGVGSSSGVTEKLSDTDLFKFIAVASGPSSVTVSRPTGSTAIPKVSIIEFISGVPTVIATGTASEGPTGFVPADTGSFQVTRNSTYYVLVENTGGRFGKYSVNVNGSASDDYPNEGEFGLAFEIPINSSTGDGALGTTSAGDSSNPRLNPDGDTDLFKFRPAANGAVSILVTSYFTTLGRFAPRIRIFDSSGTLLAGGDVSSSDIPADGAPAQVAFTFANGVAGATYYILVSAVEGLPPPATLTGDYRVAVDGAGSGTGGGDNGEIDFDNPTSLNLSGRTGDGVVTDLINAAGDRDLFTFTLPAGANGPAFVQVVTPNGSVLDCSITVLNAPNETAVVVSDSAGIPGATANARFTGVGGQQYWVIVAGLGTGVGAYTLRVSTQPAKQYLYYPEGYASPTIREFVSISNNNAYNVTYSLIAYYEDGSAPSVLISNGTIVAGARDGVTTSDAANGTYRGLLKQFTPYALVLESSGPLGATLAHYDFSSTVGDSFTKRTSSEWVFARVERNPGAVNDYILYYNPNDFAVKVTVTAYTASGTVQALVQTVAGRQRLGISFNDVPTLPVGTFGVKLSAAPLNASDLPNFLGISASLSHYDVANRGGFGFIGDPDGGSTSGAVPSLTNGDSIKSELVLFNPSSSAAVITLTGKYLTPGLPNLIRTITLAAHAQLVLRDADLQFVPNQTIGLRYDSTVPITVTASQRQNGEADASGTTVNAGTSFFFGDGFINTALAGVFYFETLNFYNPTGVAGNVTVKLLFTGVTDFITVTVAVSANGFAQVKLHELPQIINDRPGLNFFSIQVDSAVPIIASMTHYDLFLGGGWTTSGVPLGLTNALSTIV